MSTKIATEQNRHTGPLWTLALILMLSALLAPRSEAATISVDQGGTCTLPDAIQAASSDTAVGGCPKGSGPDIIELETDVTLTSDLPFVQSADPANPSQSALIINGNGHTIDGDNAFRGLTNYLAELTVNDCTITKCYGGQGSGLTNGGGNTTLNNCTISNNSNLNSSGGGIANITGASYHARLILNNCTISGNTSHGYGGGIVNSGDSGELSLTINNSVISGNTANDGTDFAGEGGGISIQTEVPTVISISGSTISGNSATSFGGLFIAGRNNDMSVTITDSSISDNSASGGGGLLFISDNGTMVIDGTTISGNTATEGGAGGIELFSYGTNGTTIRNSTISNNQTSGHGGGILATTKFSLSNCTITGNSSDIAGGGIYLDSPASIPIEMSHTYTSIERSLIAGNEAPVGAEIANPGPETFQLGGYNLIGHSLLDAAGAWQNVSFSGTDVSATSDSGSPFVLNTIIGPLKNNGGLTWTHALPSGSPAVDLAPGVDCSTPPFAVDQRGFPRPRRGGCDAGAYELKSMLLEMIVPVLSSGVRQ